MIAVKNLKPKKLNIKCTSIPDTIVLKVSEKQEIDEQGRKVIVRNVKKVNLTKLVNETAKLVKQNAVYTAEQKLNELSKIISK